MTLKGKDTATIGQELKNFIEEKFLQTSLQKYMIGTLKDQINLLIAEKDVTIQERASKLEAQAPQNEITDIDQKIASLNDQISKIQQISQKVTDNKIFDTNNFKLISSSVEAPAELPALAHFLKNNNIDAYKQKINQMIDTVQAEISAMEKVLSSLSNDQLRQLGRLQETARELASLRSITDYDSFAKVVAEQTNLIRDILKTVINEFSQDEQAELNRLQTLNNTLSCFFCSFSK